MEVVKTFNVQRCYDCPYFINHPQEASCELLDTWNIISHRIAEREIYKDCPIKNGKL